jgi:hypothetical protein
VIADDDLIKNRAFDAFHEIRVGSLGNPLLH